MQMIYGMAVVMFVLIGATVAHSDNAVGGRRVQEATTFAKTLVSVALPAGAEYEILLARQAEPAPWACRVQEAAPPRAFAALAGDTPERACYGAVEKMKSMLERRATK